MIWSLITFGGILFWLLAAVFALIVTHSVNKQDSWAVPAFWSVVALALTYAFTDAPVPDFTVTNILIGIVSWFGIGTVWAIGKWVHLAFQIRNFARSFTPREIIQPMSDEARAKDEADQLREAVSDEFKPHDASWRLNLPPKASEFKTRISTWITFWPASMLATIMGDLIAPAVEFLFNVGGNIAKGLAGTFSAISKRIYES